MRFVLAVLSLVALSGHASAAEPAMPATRGQPSVDPAMPKLTVARFLEKLPGIWTGEQVMRCPSGSFMTMRVTETYREEKRGDRAGLAGELVCTIGSGDKAKTLRSTSFTWGEAGGKGHSEVMQDGKTEKYITFVSGDTLVFIPDTPLNKDGVRDKPENGSGLSELVEKDAVFLVKKGFVNAPDGVYLIRGKLKKKR